MEIPLLSDIVTVFALAIAVILLCHRLRVPTTVGFLLTGILVGPHGLGLISAVEEVKTFAEIGVVLLLFTIGLEFSLKDLSRVGGWALLAGASQVLITILTSFLLFRLLGWGSGKSIFIGFLFSLSSTAIVLQLLQTRAEVESPHGKVTLAILIFQDIAVVPMMLLTPILSGMNAQAHESFLTLSAKATGIILLALVSAKWIVPKVLYQVARTQSRELFLLTILVICFAVASLTYNLGLSLALGAFLAGLVVSETEYSHQTLSNVLPFRDVFMSLFFVSVGMLLDMKFLMRQPVQVIFLALGVMTLKAFLANLAVILAGFPLRTAVLSGMALCQVGEFSFILFMKGTEYGLLSGDLYNLFLAVSVLTMGATPFAVAYSPQLADAALRLPLLRRLKTRDLPWLRDDAFAARKLQDHMIIVGFGFNGQNVARAAKVAGVPYAIIEMNPETVRKEKATGEPICYGDAVHDAVLHRAFISTARVTVVVISDPVATRRIVAAARRLNPKLYIIARTRFLKEVNSLYELGANEVIPEEFETSVEIFSRVLAKYLIPKDEIERFIAETRAAGYQMFRGRTGEPLSLPGLRFHLPDVEVGTIRVRECSSIAGQSLSEIQLRNRYKVTLVAIKRGSQVLANPDGRTRVLPNDILIIFGSPGNIAHFSETAQGGRA